MLLESIDIFACSATQINHFHLSKLLLAQKKFNRIFPFFCKRRGASIDKGRQLKRLVNRNFLVLRFARTVAFIIELCDCFLFNILNDFSLYAERTEKGKTALISWNWNRINDIAKVKKKNINKNRNKNKKHSKCSGMHKPLLHSLMVSLVSF